MTPRQIGSRSQMIRRQGGEDLAARLATENANRGQVFALD
jgi:hypothetical protein